MNASASGKRSGDASASGAEPISAPARRIVAGQSSSSASYPTKARAPSRVTRSVSRITLIHALARLASLCQSP
jgi:hypothetical protein